MQQQQLPMHPSTDADSGAPEASGGCPLASYAFRALARLSHASRIALAGSTREALAAGTQQASVAIVSSDARPPMKTAGSSVPTLNSMPASSRVAAAAAINPATVPM